MIDNTKDVDSDWTELVIKGEGLDDDNEKLDTGTGDQGTGDDDQDFEETSEVESAEDSEDDATDQENDEAEQAAKVKDAKAEPGKRSAERIADLANALKRQDETHKQSLERIRGEIAERDKARDSETQLALRETALAQTKANLETRIKSLESSYKAAREDGDSALEIKIIKDIQRAELERLATDTDLASIEEAREKIKEAPKARAQEPASKPNPRAAAWLGRNGWIEDAPVYVQRAIAAQVETLLQRGADVNSDEFYDKVDRMTDAWLKASDITDYSVNFRTQSKPTGKEKAVETTQTKTKPKSSHPSSERGSGDGPVLGRTKDGKVRVKVTEDDREAAKMFGIKKDDKERMGRYMKERIKTEAAFNRQNKDTGTQWVDI